ALADVLQIEVPRVRELAREALAELTPITAGRVDGDWRGQVADYMLGQQSGPEATATRAHLKRSEPARTWAMSLLDTLDELYASGNAPTVPDIDTGVRERARARREERPKERERDRERDRDRERERERDREREREPLRKEARDSDTATLSPAAEAVVRRRRLIGAGLGAVVVALVVLLATGTFSSSSKKKSSSARATTTAAQTQIIGRIPLAPAKSGVK